MELFKALFKIYFARMLAFMDACARAWQRFYEPIRLRKEKKRLRAKGYFTEDATWAEFFADFKFCKCFIIKKILYPNFYAIKNSIKWEAGSKRASFSVGSFAYDEIAWVWVPRAFDGGRKNDLAKLKNLLQKIPALRYEQSDTGIKIFGYECGEGAL